MGMIPAAWETQRGGHKCYSTLVTWQRQGGTNAARLYLSRGEANWADYSLYSSRDSAKEPEQILFSCTLHVAKHGGGQILV